jgi:hypothetical protein
LASAAAACGGDDSGEGAPACVALPETCTPSIDPTWPEIYGKILNVSCGATGTGTTCHGSAGLQGGFGVYDMNMTYDGLIGTSGKARVMPGMPECSLLMERLTSDDPNFRMPRGSPKLDAGLLCAVQKWIENGAAK